MSSFLPAFSYSFLACVILFLPFCLFYSSNSFLFILCFPTPLSPSFVLYFSRCHLLQLLSIFLILSICYSLTLVATLSYTFLAPLLFLSVYLSPSLFPSSRRSFRFSSVSLSSSPSALLRYLLLLVLLVLLLVLLLLFSLPVRLSPCRVLDLRLCSFRPPMSFADPRTGVAYIRTCKFDPTTIVIRCLHNNHVSLCHLQLKIHYTVQPLHMMTGYAIGPLYTAAVVLSSKRLWMEVLNSKDYRSSRAPVKSHVAHETELTSRPDL